LDDFVAINSRHPVVNCEISQLAIKRARAELQHAEVAEAQPIAVEYVTLYLLG
jgi:hypothetical protein